MNAVALHSSLPLMMMPTVLSPVQSAAEAKLRAEVRQLRQEVARLRQSHQDLALALDSTIEAGHWLETQVRELQGLRAEVAERRATEAELQQQQLMSDQLLLNMLPPPIADRLKQGQSIIADSFDEATVMFADIVGFTELSARIDPAELVQWLNQIFSVFDQLADRYGLEKIKTIGDAYLVVGGLPNPKPDHVAAIANMGLDMLQASQQFCTPDQQPLHLRIGIHTGPVVAGVIGTRKLNYDIWGDTVNIASRMESQGETGRIQVSEAVYECLKSSYQLQARGNVPIKGKGVMPTYWLDGRVVA
jgi:class 3 adenylate cyclase